MSYIQFESAREKEKARADLREAREQMLEQAKKRAEIRAEREASKQLRGEKDWMLPSIEKKFNQKKKKEKNIKKKKKDTKSKKAKKKSSKKYKHRSSSDESDSSEEDESCSTVDNTSSCSSDEDRKRKNKSKKSKKSRKQKRKGRNTSCSGSESESDEKAEWVEAKRPEIPIQRDSWMTDPLMLKTFSKEPAKQQPKEKQQIDVYDPAKSSRELNPYWKSTGTGLPAFQKPGDEDAGGFMLSSRSTISSGATTSRGWRKQNFSKEPPRERKLPTAKRSATPSERSSSSSEPPSEDEKKEKQTISTSQFLTDQQMNELGAKIVKAEIMGNVSLADELRQKLEAARAQRNLFKERKRNEIVEGRGCNKNIAKTKEKEEDHILLTHTDQSGQSRPLAPTKAIDPRDLYGGKKKQKRVKTHDDDGQRIRYFADDDRYDIKQMFESEKMTSVSDTNLQFADFAGKNENPNDDLEDIFADKICKDVSVREARKERDHAIREHQKMEIILDNCEKCFDSGKLQKELLVSVGEKVYLALPWYQGLQSGHCMIVPTQHSTCCTQLDEDTWAEINDYRKALTRMFAAQRKDVIFFEIANRLHKRPHLVIHCVPIKESDGEMAPFYFKKAIEESEHEWSVNKQLVSLRNKSLRSCIPKGLPYFWVNFGMDTGFAHVIEDESRFPPNFAQEIIGGMLHLDANKWRRLQKEQNVVTKVKLFADWWKKYDCTQ